MFHSTRASGGLKRALGDLILSNIKFPSSLTGIDYSAFADCNILNDGGAVFNSVLRRY